METRKGNILIFGICMLLAGLFGGIILLIKGFVLGGLLLLAASFVGAKTIDAI